MSQDKEFWRKETARAAFLQGWATHNNRGRISASLEGAEKKTAEWLFEEWWQTNYD